MNTMKEKLKNGNTMIVNHSLYHVDINRNFDVRNNKKQTSESVKLLTRLETGTLGKVTKNENNS